MDISGKSSADDNRRECIRCSSLAVDDRVTLSDGSKQLLARCTDRSAEGFGLRCEAKIPWTVGQTVMLSREEGSYEVRIAFVREQDGGARMGVQRVRDFMDDSPLVPSYSPWRWFRSPRYYTGQSNLWLIGLCFVSLVCVAAIGFLLRPALSMQGGERPLALRRPDIGVTKLLAALTGQQRDADEPPAGRSRVGRDRHRGSSEELWDEVVSGTREVTWTHVEDLLQLTDDQSQKLLALLNKTLSEVPFQGKPSPTYVPDGRTQLVLIVESLADKDVTFLNDQQQAKLKTLLTSLSRL